VAANGTNTIYKIPSTYIGYTTVVTSVLIDTPVAISALPGGDLLVAADGTVDAIMRVTTSGTVVGTFVKNAFTGRVRDIYVMPPQ
jgi:hypothetical protein